MLNMTPRMGFPGSSMVKNLPANAGDIRDTGLVPDPGRSPGEGSGHPLQYSCQRNAMDRGAGQAPVHGVVKNLTWLSDWATAWLLGHQCFEMLTIELTLRSGRPNSPGRPDRAVVPPALCFDSEPVLCYSQAQVTFLAQFKMFHPVQPTSFHLIPAFKKVSTLGTLSRKPFCSSFLWSSYSLFLSTNILYCVHLSSPNNDAAVDCFACVHLVPSLRLWISWGWKPLLLFLCIAGKPGGRSAWGWTHGRSVTASLWISHRWISPILSLSSHPLSFLLSVSQALSAWWEVGLEQAET